MKLPGWLQAGPTPGARVDAALATTALTQTGISSTPIFRADNHLQAVTWADLLGTDYRPVTRAEAMSVPAIARARHVLTSTIARCELRLYRGDHDDPQQLATPQLLRQPDAAARVSRFLQIAWTVDDLIFYGRSLWFVTERYVEDGRPRQARRISWDRVQLDQRRGPDGFMRPVWTIDGLERDSRDVLLIDGFHEGILSFGASTVRGAAQLERTWQRVAANPVAYVELHMTKPDPTMTDAKIDALIARWSAARRGENGGVAFTNDAIETKMHGSPAEHLLTAGRNAAAVDGARIVGVPADTVDAAAEQASMTYANVETRNRTLIDYGLAAYAACIEARLSLDDVHAAGSWVAFHFAQLTEPSAVQQPAPPRPAPTPEVAP